MSILTELKKLTKKKNATVVSQALPDSLDGSGSGGGANVLTLYAEQQGQTFWAYKDPEHTQEYISYDEALAAVSNAGIIKVVIDLRRERCIVRYPDRVSAVISNGGEYVTLDSFDGNDKDPVQFYLWQFGGVK